MMVARCRVLVLMAVLAPCYSFRASTRPARLSAATGNSARGASVCTATSTTTDAQAAAIGAFRTPTTTTSIISTTSTATRRRRCFPLVLKAEAGTGDEGGGGGDGGGGESRQDPAENATSGDEPKGDAHEGDGDGGGERMELRDFRARLMSKGLDGWGTAAGAGGRGGAGGSGEGATGGREAAPSSDRWAHPLAQPELGCLLIANESLFTQQQQYFYRAVMLVIQYDDDGTVALILNRPTTFTMRDVCTGSLQRVPGMEDNVLYMGGYVAGARDDGLDVVNLMHGRDDVPGVEVVKGLRLGGLKEALALVADGKADPEEFKFFSRYSGWGPGQLEAEVLAGHWVLAACDLESVLRCQNHPDQPGHFWNEIMSRLSHQQRREEAGEGL